MNNEAAFKAYLAILPPEQAAAIRARPENRQFQAAVDLAKRDKTQWPDIDALRGRRSAEELLQKLL